MESVRNLFRWKPANLESMVDERLSGDNEVVQTNEEQLDNDDQARDGDEDEDEDPAQDDDDKLSLIDGMNDAAKSKPSPPATSPRKRGRPSDGSQASPNKRPKTQPPPVELKLGLEVDSPSRRAGLRSRKSSAPRHSVNRTDIYGVPDDAPPEPRSEGRALPPTSSKKSRTLARKPQSNPSPFKGRGELDISASGHVDLEDSYPKTTVTKKNSAPKGKTITSQKLRGERRTSPRRKARVSGLTDSKDISDLIAANDSDQASQPTAEGQAEHHEQMDKSPKGPGRRSEASKTSANTQQISPHEPGNTSEPHAQAGNSECDVEENGAELNTRTGKAGGRRTFTQLSDRGAARKAKHRIYEAQLQKKGLALLRDKYNVADAAALHDLSAPWADIIAEAITIRDDRESQSPEHPSAIVLKKLITQQTQLYVQTANQVDADGIVAIRPELEENTRILSQRINRLRPKANLGKVETTQERVQDDTPPVGSTSRATPSNSDSDLDLGRDLYEHVIPKLLFSLVKLLGTRYSAETKITEDGYEDLLNLLSVIDKTIYKARHWEPMPGLNHNLRSRIIGVHRRVKDELRSVYQKELNALRVQGISQARELQRQRQRSEPVQRTLMGQRQRDELEASQQADNERARRDYIARYAATLNRIRYRAEESTLVNGSDRYLDGAQNIHTSPRPQPASRVEDHASRNGSVVADDDIQEPSSQRLVRPHLRREQTEEIPGPLPSRWTHEETDALLTGLQRFTAAKRFEHVLAVYGSDGDILDGRDLEELKLQATFIKQSMASRLAGELHGDHSWDWLRSVPE